MPFSCIQERLFCYKSICLQSSRETAENIECRIQKYRNTEYRNTEYRNTEYRNTEYRPELRTPKRPTNSERRTPKLEPPFPNSEPRTPNSKPNPWRASAPALEPVAKCHFVCV